MTAVQRPTPNYGATQPITKCAGQERRPQDQKIWSYPPFPKCAQNFRRTIRRTVISSSPNFHTHKTPRRTIRRTDHTSDVPYVQRTIRPTYHTSDVPYVILLFCLFCGSCGFPKCAQHSQDQEPNSPLNGSFLSTLNNKQIYLDVPYVGCLDAPYVGRTIRRKPTYHTSDVPSVENYFNLRLQSLRTSNYLSANA